MTGQFGVVVALTSFMMMWARFLSFGDDNNMLRVIYWTVLGLNALVTVISISVACKSHLILDL